MYGRSRLALALFGLGAACSEGGSGPSAPGSLDGNVLAWDGDFAFADAGSELGGGRDASGFERDVGDASVDDRGDLSDAGSDPCAETPGLVVTSTEAATNDALLGRLVEVRGRLTPAELDCTTEACSADEPCCQACVAPMRLDGVLTLRSSACRDALIGCSGSNCATTCAPPVLGTEIRVVGRLVTGDDGAVLEVWNVAQ